MIDPSRLQAFDDFMIVKLDEQARKTAGGVLLPAGMNNKETKFAVEGEVIAVGPGHQLDSGAVVPIDVAVGDVVVFNPWAGSTFELEVGGPKFLWLSQRNVFGRIRPATEHAMAGSSSTREFQIT